MAELRFSNVSAPELVKTVYDDESEGGVAMQTIEEVAGRWR